MFGLNKWNGEMNEMKKIVFGEPFRWNKNSFHSLIFIPRGRWWNGIHSNGTDEYDNYAIVSHHQPPPTMKHALIIDVVILSMKVSFSQFFTTIFSRPLTQSPLILADTLLATSTKWVFTFVGLYCFHNYDTILFNLTFLFH